MFRSSCRRVVKDVFGKQTKNFPLIQNYKIQCEESGINYRLRAKQNRILEYHILM